MQLDAFDVLIGLRLSIVRRAADMLGLHFGTIRAHPSGKGTVADYALHIQCPWRLDGPDGTITGRNDLWEYAGPGDCPPNWTYDDGQSLQDRRLATLFVRDVRTRSWINESDRFVVTAAHQTRRGDVRLELANDYVILVFPAGCKREAWRLFAPGDDRHLVFPAVETDFAISRRKPVDAEAQGEALLKVVEAPAGGCAMRAPPPIILTAGGARYRCGKCGTVLAIAELGALKGFVIHCTACDRHNEVPI
jgi:hypothetical protein